MSLLRHRALVLTVGIAISAVFLWLALRNVSASAMREAVMLADYRLLLPFTLCLLAFYWLRTYRWKLLLGHISRVTTRELLGPVMIGYGANFLLPFQLGEIARTYAAKSKTKLPLMPLAFSIVIERLFDFLVILLSLAAALAFHRQLPAYVTHVGVVAALAVAGLACGTVLLAIFTEPALQLAERLLFFVSDRLRQRLLRMLRSGARGLQSILNRSVAIKVALVSIGQWGIFAACIWLTLYAVGITAAVPTLLLILSLIVLGSSIPNAPGYLGSIQAGYVLALEATDGDATRGLAASVVFHVIYAVTAIGFGLVALRRAHMDLRTVRDIGRRGDMLASARAGGTDG